MASRVRARRASFVGREVRAFGLASGWWHDAYHQLLTMSWRRFFALVLAGYLAINALFAAGYFELGGALENADPQRFLDSFFFSVQTLATIGYGKIVPRTIAANLLVTIEALIGMIGIAVTTGLVYARFARPTARIVFSRVLVVTTFDGHPSLLFRMANARGTGVSEARARLFILRTERTAEGERLRRIHDLPLVRPESPVFALTWTAVHRLGPDSPLHGVTPEALGESDVDIIATVSGLDDGLGQTIHARYAWRPEHVVFNRRFADVLGTAPGGTRTVDYTRFHDTVEAG